MIDADNNSLNPSDFEEIDFSKLINLLLRNKKTIFLVTISTFALSIFYLIWKKPVWEGQFQIVIAEKKQPFNQ
ncbi:Wzz/FepE/Etk N-terminal domain-containing protein [Prochlorococcus marinus]|uniref:Wzz/FepE/Etk N-terminal domain-containing protein n=1 Tax=Prochlorococcus marinus TaxID=1219 RepID=UPI00094D5349|nr:Wzz/FepE/Etk N-terminal domain-containing protein [Prochlorococcus marinus]